MNRSEIFDEFVKIAEEKGLISNDSSDSKKRLDKDPRADSLDISAIEALYGIKPNTPKDMEYERNIMEDAHPNSVVISPSYDKLNGLVENNNERQNILLHIVNKTPNGLLTQKKYAEKELTLSLVRIANDLDNRNQDSLRALADFCLLQTSKKKLNNGLVKIALWPAIIVGIAVGIGALYAQQHLPNLSQGLKNDYDRLVGELNDFLTSSVSWGMGHEYDQALKTDVQGLLDRLQTFWTTYESLDSTMRQIEKPADAKDFIEKAKEPKNQEVYSAHQRLMELITNMSTYINTIESDFNSDIYKQRHTTQTGGVSSVLEKLHLSGGGTSLMADDFEEVVRAISPFKSSVAEVLKMLEKAKTVQDDAFSKLSAAQAKNQSDFGTGMQSPTETAAPADRTVEDIDNEAGEFGL